MERTISTDCHDTWYEESQKCRRSPETFGKLSICTTALVDRRDVDSRVRPTNLVASPTSRPKASKELTVKRVLVREKHKPDCKLGEYRRILQRATFTPERGTFDIGEPDAVGGLRPAIKALSVNLGASVFEYRESVNLFVGLVNRLRSAYNCYRAIRRGGLGGNARQSVGRNCRRIVKQSGRTLDRHDVTGAHLGVSFGVIPLMGDVHDSVNALQDRLAEPILRRVSSSDSVRSSMTFATSSWGGAHVGEKEIRDHAVAYIRLRPDWKPITMGNPLEVAWELVPLSFMIDWAVPIGQFLSSLDALEGIDVVSGTLTRRESIRYEDNRNGTIGGRLYECQQKGRIVIQTHRRDVISTSLPMPRVLRWEPSSSWRKLAIAVSVLDQLQYRSKRRPGR